MYIAVFNNKLIEFLHKESKREKMDVKESKRRLKVNRAFEIRKLEKEKYFQTLENKRKSVLGKLWLFI